MHFEDVLRESRMDVKAKALVCRLNRLLHDCNAHCICVLHWALLAPRSSAINRCTSACLLLPSVHFSSNALEFAKVWFLLEQPASGTSAFLSYVSDFWT